MLGYIAQKMPYLLIPLINEVFQTNYPEDIHFQQLRNEHYEKLGKIITDSILQIEDHTYHLEYQSSLDGRMVIRMFEYDFSIALELAQKNNETFEIEFPLLRYESFLKNSDSNTKKLEQLLTDYQKISSSLELCTDDKKSSLYENDCQFFKHSTVFFNPSRISVFATHPIFSILSGFKVALVAVE